jgi:hypothetical protein
VSDARLHSVRGFLARHAEDGWRVLERAGNLPSGWRVITGVRITHAVHDAPDELWRLAPRLHTATRLDGGLQVAPRQYLVGGEPDLWITVERGERASVELDDRTLTVSEGVLEIQLASLDPPLPTGSHEIVAGGIRRHFSTFGGFPVAAPTGVGALGHILERHSGYLPSSTDAEVLPAEPRRGQVFVCGASTLGAPDDLPEAVQPPVLVPTGFRAYVVLGARPGEVLTLLPPGKPDWLRAAGVTTTCQFFDQPLPFEPAWLIVEGNLGKQVRPLQKPPPEPDLALLPLRPARSEGAVGVWCETITAAAANAAPVRSYAETWERYVAAAA